MSLFRIENLRMELGGRMVLDIPDLKIPEGRITALTGPNGAGKTTLLMLLGGLIQPRSGHVYYRNLDLFAQSTAQKDQIRQDVGTVLQSPYLFKSTVLKNVTYGLVRRGIGGSRATLKAREALKLVGLTGFEDRSHSALSGGEAQRVALARALVLEPGVLLLDEPFANVDTVSRSVIESVMLKENRSQRTSIVFTTHDPDQACRMTDNVVSLYEGSVHEGSMENLFQGAVRMTPDGPVFDTGSIKIAIPEGMESALTAVVPPDSIIVSITPVDTSARNRLKGRIKAVKENNGRIDVLADVGETLSARITKGSYERMGLMLGREVYFIFKAEAVRLY